MKKVFLPLVIIIGTCSIIKAQDKSPDVKYRRSSLHTMVIESDKFPKKDVVIKAFNNAAFPDKYNDHQIGAKSFNPVNYTLSAEEKGMIYKPSKAGKLAASAADL